MDYNQALSKAAAICSSSEHCISDIESKMEKWGVSAPDSEKVIAYLTKEKYIDESRYAKAYCADKFRYNHWGRYKIRQMLHMQHISDSLISQALDQIDGDEYTDMLHSIMERKNREIKDTDPYKRKGKLIRHALSRGFEMDIAMDIAEEVMGDDE